MLLSKIFPFFKSKKSAVSDYFLILAKTDHKSLKKLAAILLLLLFLFNIVGYRAWFYFEQQQSDKQVRSSLDNNDYNENDLITIKIPVSIPYQSDWKDFERVDGEVTLNGKIYKYVKRKICDGQLVLLCFPDENKMRLQSAKDDFFKLANDLQQNTSQKKSGSTNTVTFKNVLSDYDKQNEESLSASQNTKKTWLNPQDIYLLPSVTGSTPEQPPETGTV